MGLTSDRLCSREKLEHRLTAPLVGEQLRDTGMVSAPGWAGELSGLFQDGRSEGRLLSSPLGAVLEQLLPGLDVVLAPAGGVRSAGRPRQILTGQAIPHLHLVEA